MKKLLRVTTDILVADQLKEWIRSSHLEPGDKLPSEQEMCTELGVGRHTLREGIKRLSELGLLESRTGVGTFVCGPSLKNLSNYLDSYLQMGKISVQQIYDVRIALESFGARAAAQRKTPEGVAALRQTVEEMRDAVEGYAAEPQNEPFYHQFVSSNVEFHMEVAKCAGNPFLLEITQSVKSLVSRSIDSQNHTLEQMRESLEGHRQILDAIESGDGEAASGLMQLHLEKMSRLNSEPVCPR